MYKILTRYQCLSFGVKLQISNQHDVTLQYFFDTYPWIISAIISLNERTGRSKRVQRERGEACNSSHILPMTCLNLNFKKTFSFRKTAKLNWRFCFQPRFLLNQLLWKVPGNLLSVDQTDKAFSSRPLIIYMAQYYYNEVNIFHHKKEKRIRNFFY